MNNQTCCTFCDRVLINTLDDYGRFDASLCYNCYHLEFNCPYCDQDRPGSECGVCVAGYVTGEIFAYHTDYRRRPAIALAARQALAEKHSLDRRRQPSNVPPWLE